MPDEYIWISRWEEFQHYPPDRDHPPTWLKTYTRQLDDDRYLALSPYSRCLLHDLRMSFARSRHELSTHTRRLSDRVGYRVTTPDLERLNHAGFIEIVSRETLDQRLELLYTSRAPARSRRSRDREKDKVQVKTKTPRGDARATEQPDPDADLPLPQPADLTDHLSIRKHIAQSLVAAGTGQGQDITI